MFICTLHTCSNCEQKWCFRLQVYPFYVCNYWNCVLDSECCWSADDHIALLCLNTSCADTVGCLSTQEAFQARILVIRLTHLAEQIDSISINSSVYRGSAVKAAHQRQLQSSSDFHTFNPDDLHTMLCLNSFCVHTDGRLKILLCYLMCSSHCPACVNKLYGWHCL